MRAHEWLRSYTTNDSPGHNNAPAGPNGDHQCDVPVSLEESMYNAIKTIVPDAAFSLFTGDIIDHAVWTTTQNGNTFDSRLPKPGCHLL